MAAVAPDVRSQIAEVHINRPVGADALVLELRLPEAIDPLEAGRFFMLRRDDDLSPAIPRPFSVYRQVAPDRVEFLIKVFGRGTQALAASQPGTRVRLIGPLGQGWPAWQPDSGPKWLVAGGIGSAPFFMGIQQALAQGVAAKDLTLIYGGRSKRFLYDLDQFAGLGVRVIAATDDGSAGFHGNVVQACQDLATREGTQAVQVFTCGPDPMMKAVLRFAQEHALEAWVSLETYMGCGVGICNGCAVGTVEGGTLGDWPVAKCCIDGPVFRAADVELP
ncbi:MAG: dihydroorotate dehydrogenase electron transfer subunit [Planctomycetes bacterium]|nr:dihydroorotate dehydrogenase electron transfer subunit [Planctomycetota bacterium]MCB9911920.1 dihydroorotate dehydrogenase electron transfer subunit [Planctomycetota bacterium]HPF13422.1 dihydroorotate dehydrogenase electron transfer subunit [Planctomycetota bacterium]